MEAGDHCFIYFNELEQGINRKVDKHVFVVHLPNFNLALFGLIWKHINTKSTLNNIVFKKENNQSIAIIWSVRERNRLLFKPLGDRLPG